MSELAEWLLLWRVPGIGPAHFRSLVQNFGSPAMALRASPAQLQACGLRKESLKGFQNPDHEGVRNDLSWAGEPGHYILTWNDPAYPRLLNEIPNAPPLLFVEGNCDSLNDPQLALVGSRHPTPGGRETARNFAAALAAAGLTITSGLALGIDAEAHVGALQAKGVTIAVVATGLDRVYPMRNEKLAARIATQGAIVSEFPLGVAPLPEHFPRRNRIISGLSVGTLVVEAARSSGSLITARFAAEQGREVFAIPGSIHNPLSKGCHQLVRQGAKLVETVDDILEELAGLLDTGSAGSAMAPELSSAADQSDAIPAMDADYRRVLDALGYDPTPIDTVVERSGLTTESVSSMLLILELQGHVGAVAGGMYTRLNPD